MIGVAFIGLHLLGVGRAGCLRFTGAIDSRHAGGVLTGTRTQGTSLS